jgi:hypothetical protein
MNAKVLRRGFWFIAAAVLCVAVMAVYVVLVVVGLNRLSTRLVGTFYPRF